MVEGGGSGVWELYSVCNSGSGFPCVHKNPLVSPSQLPLQMEYTAMTCLVSRFDALFPIPLIRKRGSTFICIQSQSTYVRYVEYRAVSGVFQILTPHPPLHPASVSSRGVHTCRALGGVGGQYFGRRQTLQYNLSTFIVVHRVLSAVFR
jgi:hypothetical protein